MKPLVVQCNIYPCLTFEEEFSDVVVARSRCMLIKTHRHFYFTLCSLTRPVPCRAQRLNHKEKRVRKVAGQRQIRRGSSSVSFLVRQNVLTNEIGHHKGGNVPCSSSLPRLYPCLYFPRTALRGLRRKCHRFQQWPSSPTGMVACPRLGQFIRPCCRECRLLLSSGRLGD